MTIEEYADILNVDLIIRRYCNQDNRYMAKIENAEVMQDGCLIGMYGNGKTAFDAINDYVKQIRGKRIAIDSYTPKRGEFDVPKNLTGV